LETVYKAIDGTEHASEEACQRYEQGAKHREAIEKWAAEYFASPRLTRKNSNVIVAWEGYRDEVLAAVD
jgi:hypothetical protein